MGSQAGGYKRKAPREAGRGFKRVTLLAVSRTKDPISAGVALRVLSALQEFDDLIELLVDIFEIKGAEFDSRSDAVVYLIKLVGQESPLPQLRLDNLWVWHNTSPSGGRSKRFANRQYALTEGKRKPRWLLPGPLGLVH